MTMRYVYASEDDEVFGVGDTREEAEKDGRAYAKQCGVDPKNLRVKSYDTTKAFIDYAGGAFWFIRYRQPGER